MFNKKAFTLLELLIVIVLVMIVFSIGGAVFINNIKSLIFFSSDLTKESHQIGFINQLTSQLYSKYEKRDINIKIDENRISFYTGYPIFYEGFVRAEYIIEKDENNNFKKVYYEEFPYIDGNLGFEGLKKKLHR
ncbi:prepilin-type N-terminal cleavage/methylation domain-containing protein [Hydrogenothermus marinus]|uniref:Pilin/secretion family protein with methylation motif n=1 Tax=Hydrogenothermus marinus TaxID=133270 RepID=A0A3M0B7S8_9AQUI|nr:prepilin-type N-terminal cleavage/methylation domain-containing protein [Hydrogenothermus marinus]RMA93167.1 pilin/secretion family protein with methylation motif [Hydrogenothermus marinus]